VQLVSVGFTLAGLGVVAAGYHRYYDAAMLIVPFIWAVAALRRVLAKQGQAVIPRRAND